MRKGRKKSGRCLATSFRPSTSGRDDGQRGRLAGRETNGDIAHKEAASEAHTRLPACMPARLPAVRAEPKPRLYRHRMIQAVSDSSLAVLAALALPPAFTSHCPASERASGEACLVVAVVSLVPRAHTNSEIRAISTQLPPDLVCRKMHSSDDDRPTAAAEA